MAIIVNMLEIKFKDDASASRKAIFANDAHQICITVRGRAIDGTGKTITNFRPETIGGLTFAYASNGLRVPFFGFPNEPMIDNKGPLIQHRSKTKYYRDLPASVFYEAETQQEDRAPLHEEAAAVSLASGNDRRLGSYYSDDLEWGNDPESGIFWINIYFQAKNGDGALGSRDVYAVWQPDVVNNGTIFDSSGRVNTALKSILTIDIVSPIDYGALSNWQFPTSPSEIRWNEKSTVEIKSKQKTCPTCEIHDKSYEAKSRYAKFVVKSIPYQKSSRFALETVYDISNGFDLVSVETKTDYIAGDIKLATKAVAFYFKDGGRSDVYAIFVSPNGRHVGFSSVGKQIVPLQAFNHRYRIQLDDQNVPTDANLPDGFAVYVWNLDFDMDNTEQEGWGNRQVEVKVEVTDVYGNHGILRVPSVIGEGVLG
ncbi:hypothetical protein [Chromobacterium violaceum]